MVGVGNPLEACFSHLFKVGSILLGDARGFRNERPAGRYSLVQYRSHESSLCYLKVSKVLRYDCSCNYDSEV